MLNLDHLSVIKMYEIKEKQLTEVSKLIIFIAKEVQMKRQILLTASREMN